MSKKNILPKDFSPHLFWDVDAWKLTSLETYTLSDSTWEVK